ncbi:ATP phosphoribosyltransferase [Sphingorhabdus soli]|uniref:ATP phosphoribosyltransferase n=1 Tax=Flavisphingopyxis soli TaxID=2601267 RepID=A0A5C6U8R9_9SPHN|nr:ATP phosphoribosyltransferase [Sphingorhabdus soli]TXC68790.1 ATP phosphoribosyltransferase [Sphingorhabdus soli]
MFADTDRLHIAIQKNGRLADYSRDLLRDAGMRVVKGVNDLAARVENFPLDLLFVRDDDIPTFVADGVCDFGIVGGNVLEEFALGTPDAKFEIVSRLGFGRCTLKIAGKDGVEYASPASLSGKRIATSYPLIVNRFLADAGVESSIVTMNGAVELAPRLGIADFICDIVSTGATLDANGLVAFDTVYESEAVLVRAQRPVDAAKAAAAEQMLGRLEGVLATKEAKYIMLNAGSENLPAITALLPGAGAPTVLPLHGRPGQFAVHAVCQESVFWETLQKLKAAGASAILVVPIEKMMM